MSSQVDLQKPLLEQAVTTPGLHLPPNLSKRKRAAQESKKAAKKPKPKNRNADEDDELDTENGIKRAFGIMDPHLLADYVAQRTKRYESDLSLVELEDRYIPGNFGSSPRKLHLISLVPSDSYYRYNIMGQT
jgi:protein CMS1